MTTTTPAPSERPPWWMPLRNGLRASPLTVLLIAAIDTGIAAFLWIGDPRPFWHPLLSAQCFGFSIAYCVNVASPWDRRSPILRLIAAVAVGSVIGIVLIVILKGYPLEHITENPRFFTLNLLGAFGCGLFLGLFFLVKFREARAERALLKAEAEHHLLSRQAAESELKLLQAQVEPHFLFNTLASVQFLTETNPPEATRLLGHLLDYLRAALPQLRTASSTLGKELAMAQAYLSILKMRMGPRLEFGVDAHDGLTSTAFPPGLLMTLVENAIEHGLEPQADGGRVTIEAHQRDGRLTVTVTDTGAGLSGTPVEAERGIGLANVRERLAALYGGAARFALDNIAPHGARAMIEVPIEAPAR